MLVVRHFGSPLGSFRISAKKQKTHLPALWRWVGISDQPKVGSLAGWTPHTRKNLCATHAATTTCTRSLLWIREHNARIRLNGYTGKRKF